MGNDREAQGSRTGLPSSLQHVLTTKRQGNFHVQPWKMNGNYPSD